MAPLTNVFAAAAVLSLALTAQAVPYQQTENWQGGNFFDGFDFVTSDDPSGGWVTYVDKGTAQSKGMVAPNTGAPTYIGVDHSSYLDPGAGQRDRRASVRLQSKTRYNKGLFIVDVAHMPGGICGVWPAFWMVGPNWPHNGEWDIVEGVNLNTRNQMTAHTDPGCTTNGAGAVGTVIGGDCYSNNAGDGCGTLAQNTASWGAPLNNNGGGVWATEWTDSHISTWFFARNAIPSNIANPDPSAWGPPGAIISNNDGCNVDKYFSSGMNVIINTDFCGGWVAGDWGNSGCASYTGTDCVNYVAHNPGAFNNAYWSINYYRHFNPAPGFTPASVEENQRWLAANFAKPAGNQTQQVYGPGFKGGVEPVFD